MSTDGLSPAGGSQYSSNTMTVGDGTWDSSRNSFLLPNLVGFNFDTMRYNGMGNRFRDLPQYHTLIRGHGILAAIVFIGLVPAAIFIAKYGPSRHLSFKLHVYIQILVVLLSTVVLVLGWFAVGPERALTNPHHGIGVAIYVMVLVQFLYGWLMYKRERKRKIMPTKIPKKVWLHKLFGRAIAILGFVQVALGLTLYGSPKALFILYALAGFLLLFLYLALDYHYKARVTGAHAATEADYSDYTGSYLSGSRTDFTQDNRRRPAPKERESHWGRNLLAGAGALGAYEAWKHRRERKREDQMDRRTDTESHYDGPGRRPVSTMYDGSSRPPHDASTMTPGPMLGASNMTPVRNHSRRRAASESRLSPQSWEDEKYSETPQKHTWRNRFLGAGAGLGAAAGLKALFSKKKREDDYVDPGSYRPPHGGAHNMVSQSDVTRVQHGQAPFSPGDRRPERMGVGPSNLGPSTMGPSTMGPSTMAGASTLPGNSNMTPTRPPRQSRPSTDMYSYDSRESFDDDSRLDGERPQTLRNSIATFGALAGFKEWNKARKQRREDQRIDVQRQQEMAEADRFNRRNSNNYPRRQDGRRPSVSDTVFTGDPGLGSNPELSRTTFNRPNTNMPPLPATAGAVPLVGNHSSRTNITENGYVLPPPPPGPPPNTTYGPPVPGSAHMPTGAVQPDPSRLLEQNTIANESSAYGRTNTTDPTTVTGPSTGVATIATSGQRTESQSPSRYRRDESRNRLHKRRNSQTSVSQIASTAPYPTNGSAAGGPTSPVRLHVHMHNDEDGRMTIQRLPDDTSSAAAAARRQDRRSRRRRTSSQSSGGLESDAPPASLNNRRYRRVPMRPSSQQPISNVPPPPPAMSSVAGSNRPPSELNLPPPPRVPAHSASPQGLSPPVNPMAGSGMSGPGGVGSPGAYGTDAGTGTDVSAFDSNRRRRRAERARRQQQGQRVEFE